MKFTDEDENIVLHAAYTYSYRYCSTLPIAQDVNIGFPVF